MNILISESNVITRRGLHKIILDHFPEAFLIDVTDKREFKTALLSSEYDLIVIDPNPPYDYIFAEPYHHYPIIIYSILPQADHALKFLSLGAMAYLEKGSSVDEFVMAITAVLNGKRYINKGFREQLFKISVSNTAKR